jgi:hypothetical protein
MTKSYILALTALAMFCAPGLGSTGASAAGIELHGFSGPTFRPPSERGPSFESRSFTGRDGHDDHYGDGRDNHHDHHDYGEGRYHHDYAFGQRDWRNASWPGSTTGSATSGAGAGKGWNQVNNKSGLNGNSSGISTPAVGSWNRVQNTQDRMTSITEQ